MPSRAETILLLWLIRGPSHPQGTSDPGYCSKLLDGTHTVPRSSSPLPGTHPAWGTQAQDHPCPLPQWQPPAQWNVAWSPKWAEELAHPAHTGRATGGSCLAFRGLGSAHIGAERADQVAFQQGWKKPGRILPGGQLWPLQPVAGRPHLLLPHSAHANPAGPQPQAKPGLGQGPSCISCGPAGPVRPEQAVSCRGSGCPWGPGVP